MGSPEQHPTPAREAEPPLIGVLARGDRKGELRGPRPPASEDHVGVNQQRDRRVTEPLCASGSSLGTWGQQSGLLGVLLGELSA